MRGFTIIELLTVALIFSLILLATFGVLIVGRRSWHIGTTQVEVQQQSRRAMDRMIIELAQSRPSKIIAGPVEADGEVYSSVTFQIPQDIDSDGDILAADGSVEWGGQIQYSLNEDNQLLRTSGSDSVIWANNIITLEFSRCLTTPNILEITVQAEKRSITGHTLEADLTSQVSLRN